MIKRHSMSLAAGLTMFLLAMHVGAVSHAADRLVVSSGHQGGWDALVVNFGLRKGFFAAKGLDIENVDMDTGAPTIQAVVSGSIDLAVGVGMPGFMGAVMKGAPLKMISANFTGAGDFAWYARADSPIKTFKDITENNTVAYSSTGSSSQIVAFALLKQAGVTGKPTATGNASATLTQVMTGQIDVGYDGNGGMEYTMAEFIDRVLTSTDENPAPYFRNKILSDLFPSLMQDIEPLPEYCFPDWLPERYMVKYVGRVLNRAAAIELYVGGQGGAFPVLHYDGAGTHAFLMQIYGRKKFIIFPPSRGSCLYPSPEKQNFSQINIDKPDLNRFPLYAEAVPTTFVLEPGEILFVPSHWWHTTKMLTPSITISVNTVNQSNWQELIEYVAMRRPNPFLSLCSRAYLTGAGAWRAWRDRNWSKSSEHYGMKRRTIGRFTHE